MGVRSDAGAVHKRACTNLGRAGQDLYSDTGDAIVVFAMELAVAEARRIESLVIDWVPTKYVQIVFPRGQGDLPRSHTVYDDPARTDGG